MSWIIISTVNISVSIFQIHFYALYLKLYAQFYFSMSVKVTTNIKDIIFHIISKCDDNTRFVKHIHILINEVSLSKMSQYWRMTYMHNSIFQCRPFYIANSCILQQNIIWDIPRGKGSSPGCCSSTWKRTRLCSVGSEEAASPAADVIGDEEKEEAASPSPDQQNTSHECLGSSISRQLLTCRCLFLFYHWNWTLNGFKTDLQLT